MSKIVCVTLLLSFSVGMSAKPRPFDARFERLIAREMRKWGVPGLAIAVVSRDRVIYAKGFGVKHIQRRQAVDTATLFAIGSLTKAFTAALIGILVDRGKLRWNQPVRERIPEFTLKDPFASAQITPRDLLIHNSGLPRHDLLWYGGFSRKELIRRMRYLDPSAGFRERYQYSNLMYMVAGYLAGRVTHSSWEQQLRTRLLAPLGMHRTTLSAQGLRQSANWAKPHRIEGFTKPQVSPVPYRDVDAIAPAGSIGSNVEEMGKWLQLLLNNGQVGQRVVIKPGTVRQILSPQIVAPNGFQLFQRDPRFKGQLSCCTYAMGWGVAFYRGQRLLSHSGGLDGYRSKALFLPDAGYGVVVLTNGERGSVATVAAMAALDRLLGKPTLPFSDFYDKALHRIETVLVKMERQGVAKLRPKTSHRPTHALKHYVGRFSHPAYGEIRILRQKDSLYAQFREFKMPLVHLTYNTFAVTGHYSWLRYRPSVLRFLINETGKLASFTVYVDPHARAATFRRVLH